MIEVPELRVVGCWGLRVDYESMVMVSSTTNMQMTCSCLLFSTRTFLETEKGQLRRCRHVFKRSGSGWHTDGNIEIDDSAISPAKCVQNLGFNMDQHLSMVQQVTSVCGTCNYHLYRISSIRQFLTTDATRSAVQALITSRLD